jgi:hypothetical protein
VGAAASTRARVRADVVWLAHRGLGMHEFAGRVRRTLATAVPFDGACLSTVDPATLLPTGCAAENALPPAATLRLFELEAIDPDFNAFTALARGDEPAARATACVASRCSPSVGARRSEGRRPSRAHRRASVHPGFLGGPAARPAAP